MKTKEEIVKILKELKKELKEKYRVREIGVFGSLVRGERIKESDIDVLVDFEEDADLLHLVGLALFLEEKLQSKVDVVPRRALRDEIKESVLKEAVAL